jgi:hypothetical protein
VLLMLEKMVTDAGGTYLMCDTDSMAVVASFDTASELQLSLHLDHPGGDICTEA